MNDSPPVVVIVATMVVSWLFDDRMQVSITGALVSGASMMALGVSPEASRGQTSQCRDPAQTSGGPVGVALDPGTGRSTLPSRVVAAGRQETAEDVTLTVTACSAVAFAQCEATVKPMPATGLIGTSVVELEAYHTLGDHPPLGPSACSSSGTASR
ncbi:MAG: hypothetical protein M3083_03095 [Actinomycetota bacterium]|nr:hypothetical protein [Actinomycetota bacterium]